MSPRQRLRAAPSAPAAPRPIDAPDDDELVRAAQQGDRLAFEALFRRHVQVVHARLTRLIGYSEEREDLVQQVFFRFHQSLPRFRGESSVATYLHGIVVHVAYEALRKRSRATRPLTEHELDRLVANDGTPEASARRICPGVASADNRASRNPAIGGNPKAAISRPRVSRRT